MAAIISLTNVSRVFTNGKTNFHALDNVSFQVQAGEFISIMGPSGSGKTTLLNQIGALDRPSSGEVIIDGASVSTVPESELYKVRRSKIGFVFQIYYLVPTLSILDNVLLPSLPIPGNGGLHNRAKDLLRTVGLEDKINQKPNQLSGGQQQRVAIARALILDPPIILADEPTGNLDSKTGADVFHLLKRLNRDFGKTFVIVTHDPRIAKATQRTVYLADGKIAQEPSREMEVAF